jgi:hypothetical protein
MKATERPLPESFHAAIRKEALAGLKAICSISTPSASIPCSMKRPPEPPITQEGKAIF